MPNPSLVKSGGPSGGGVGVRNWNRPPPLDHGNGFVSCDFAVPNFEHLRLFGGPGPCPVAVAFAATYIKTPRNGGGGAGSSTR